MPNRLRRKVAADSAGLLRHTVVRTALVRTACGIAGLDGLRGYGAVHLAAAMVDRATVVASADSQLIGAARKRGFGVAQPGVPLRCPRSRR